MASVSVSPNLQDETFATIFKKKNIAVNNIPPFSNPQWAYNRNWAQKLRRKGPV